jgi:hypothetical protein
MQHCLILLKYLIVAALPGYEALCITYESVNNAFAIGRGSHLPPPLCLHILIAWCCSIISNFLILNTTKNPF